MSHLIARQTAAVALLMFSLQQVSPACGEDRPPNREVTIQSETKARLRLGSEINSKLSEADDIITATLAEPLYVDGQLVLPRGVEFQGRVTRVAPAKRGQKSSQISIVFERIVTRSGASPIIAQVTAIDDWNRNEKLKAGADGKLEGGHRGEKTIENITRGAHIGYAGSGSALLLGGAAGAGPRNLLGIAGAGLAVGMIAGLFLTKGSDIRVAPGAILRIKFLRPVTLPVMLPPGMNQ